MNKLIKNELEKVTEVKINYNEDTTEIFIPKKMGIKLDEGCYYLIRLTDALLNQSIDSSLATNWNSGSVPNNKYYKVDVIKIMGGMIKINGISYDYDNRVDLNDIWSGWIPISEIEILERL